MAYSPAALVAVPVVVPFRMTVAPITGANRAAFVGHAALHGASGVSGRADLRFPPPFGCEYDFQPLDFHIHIGKHFGDDRGDAAVDGFHRDPLVGVDVGVDVGERVLAVGFDALQQLLDGNVLRIDGDGRDLGRSRGGRHRAEEDSQIQMPADPFQNVEFIHDSFGLCLIRFFKWKGMPEPLVAGGFGTDRLCYRIYLCVIRTRLPSMR